MEPGRAGTILLVDDHEAGRVAHACLLARAGHDVVQAASGEQALSILEQRPLDLVILDIALPGCSGRAVLRHIKSSPRLALVPVMYLSATYPEAADIAAGLEAGVDAYLTKPVPLEVLLAQVAALLRVRRLHLELARAREEADARATALETAERASRDSEHRFRSLVEVTSDWIWEIDAQGRYTYASPKVKELLGYEPSEVVGKTPFDLMPPEEAERVRAEVGPRLARGQPFAILVNRNLHRDGHEVVLETSGVPVLDGAGTLRGFRGVDRDITARLQAEQERERLVTELERTARELEEQRGLLAAVLEQMPSGVVVAEAPSGRFVLANRRAAEIRRGTGKAADRLEEFEDYVALRPDGRPFAKEELPLSRALRGEVVLGEEIVHPFADGEFLTVRASAAPVRSADGAIDSAVVVFDDVTAQRQAEEALRASEERYRTLFESMQEGFFLAEVLCDDAGRPVDGCFLEMNPAAEALFGRTRQEIIGRRYRELFPESNCEYWTTHLGQVALTGEPVRLEQFGRGTGRHYEVFAHSPAPGQVAVFLSDISVRVRAEQERARLLAEAEEKQRLLDAIMEYIPEGITIASAPNVTTLATSRYAMDLLTRGWETTEGLSMEDWLARVEHYLADGVTPARVEDLPLWRAVKYGQTTQEQELVVRTPDGRFLPLLCNAGPIRDAEGQITGGIIAWRDIHLRKRRQEALAQVSQRLQWLLAALPVGVSFSEDPECRWIAGNPACLAQFEMRPQDNISASALDETAPGRQVRYLREGREVPESDLPLQRAVAENREVGPVQLEVVLPSGRHWLCEASGAPIHDLQGRVVGGVAVTVDITQRRRLEEVERARAREARLLETIQENVPVCLAYLDQEFRFVRVNTPYLQRVGCSRDDLLGRSYRETTGGPAVLKLLEQARTTAQRADMQEARRTPAKGGPCQETSYWDLFVTPVTEHGQAIAGYVFAASDVTDRVEQRDRLLAAERARAEIAESLNDEIAHRVKNNLAMVSGLLSMQVLSESNPETAAALRAAVTRVRTFANIHEQMYTQPGEEMDLLEALRRITNTTRSVFSSRQEVEIGVQGERVVCPARDVTNLCVVANELLTNALKHGLPDAQGKLCVHVQLTARAEHLVLSVWNSGASLAADFDLSRHRGMGLRLVTDLVGQYEGEFQLGGRADGTTAEVKIPRAAMV